MTDSLDRNTGTCCPSLIGNRSESVLGSVMLQFAQMSLVEPLYGFVIALLSGVIVGSIFGDRGGDILGEDTFDDVELFIEFGRDEGAVTGADIDPLFVRRSEGEVHIEQEGGSSCVHSIDVGPWTSQK